jgi:hypothetical protein
LPERIIGQVNPAWFALVFHAGRDVDAITEDVVFIENNVPDVNANPEFDPLILRQRRILLGHRRLSFNGTAYGIHRTGKLNQQAVARGLDDPAPVGGYSGVKEGLSDRLEPGQRAFLIATHQAAIPGDIRRQHRCQSSIDALGGQRTPLELQSRPFASKHIEPLLD